MCVDSLHKVSTNDSYRVLFVTPYENQVRLIFTRLKELIELSPLLKGEVIKLTSNPYQIMFSNGSGIMGFTTGASSGSGGASIRGQRGDYIYMDEVDYMTETDFDTVTTIAAERDDIGIFLSSTPTGKRSKFYQACTDPKMGYTEHYHPSTHNPNWSDTMEAEFRAQLTPSGYIHEVMAEFGVQDAGVFNKSKVDLSYTHVNYAYNDLSVIQLDKAEREGSLPLMINNKGGETTKYNPFRTIGVKVLPINL